MFLTSAVQKPWGYRQNLSPNGRGRYWEVLGPPGSRLPCHRLPADKSNISICQTSARSTVHSTLRSRHQTFLYPCHLCGPSETHCQYHTPLAVSTFFAKISTFIALSRSLSFYAPILIFNQFLSREILPSGSAKMISKCALSFVFLS